MFGQPIGGVPAVIPPPAGTCWRRNEPNLEARVAILEAGLAFGGTNPIWRRGLRFSRLDSLLEERTQSGGAGCDSRAWTRFWRNEPIGGRGLLFSSLDSLLEERTQFGGAGCDSRGWPRFWRNEPIGGRGLLFSSLDSLLAERTQLGVAELSCDGPPIGGTNPIWDRAGSGRHPGRETFRRVTMTSANRVAERMQAAGGGGSEVFWGQMVAGVRGGVIGDLGGGRRASRMRRVARIYF
jgi:hypothetical protein